MEDQNILWLVFTQSDWRVTIVDWYDVVGRLVAEFRAAMAEHLPLPPRSTSRRSSLIRQRRHTDCRTIRATYQAAPGIAPSASLIRVQTFMLTTTATISRISSGRKCSASASWKRWNAASRSVSAARVSASV